MADVPEPSYITVEEVKTQTAITNLKNLNVSGDLKLLIQTAEDQIDAFVGRQKHHPDDTNTDRAFPRVCDLDTNGAAKIPYEVSRACLRQVEFLFTEWYSSRETEPIPVEYDVEAVSVSGDGGYSERRAAGGGDFSSASLSPQAKALLKRFVSRFKSITIEDPDRIPSAT